MFQKLKTGIKILFVWQLCNFLLVLSMVLGLVFLGGIAAKSQPIKIEDVGSVDIVEKYKGEGVILEIPIDGIIFRNTEEEFWGEKRMGAYERIIADLDKVKEDNEVKAVLFRVNSPGGAVSACDRLYQIIKEFKKDSEVPLFAFYESVAASGGVYTTVGAEYIMAAPTCVTGSIGVIMGGMKVKKLLDKIGLESEPYKSGKFKDMGSGMRETSAEEKRLIQGVVDELYNRFVDIVLEGRGERVTREKVIALEGSFFLSKTALENGLIDSVGTYEDMINVIHNKIGVKVNVIQYTHRQKWENFIEIFNSWLPKKIKNRLQIEGPLYLYDF